MTRLSPSGAFITFEGGEGAGKSTQLRAVAPRLRELGHDVIATREPGGSPGAEALRDLLLFGEHDLSARAEIMTHFAARCDHVDRVIRPALAAGKIVLCDRFFDSTMAYQGYGRGNGDPDLLALIHSLRNLTGLTPDLTILFEVGLETGRKRITARTAVNDAARPAPGATDRYESADMAFHARVAQGFEAIAREEPARFIRVSSETSGVETITNQVVSRIEAFLKAR
ncbi:dTMP kinase [Acetobacter oeni]|uniref:Thymidylate kinase n=1 Tax=Acetobacter oeni TaxID=304077 RepID=A0A511XKM9_9PROT|nr:dTMP kinase [Acetobacter oeni]MBB3881316.1 dTMP kinase [Acetobacter oeni]NHO18188.1 dTMP kinase [Acetobacter oeni]GBR11373.1 thymidylate kinase [Acetobacter oeni LMG 21952]GEN63490.1 thymidylate kinase [Acetobacter oeni]